MQKINSRTMKTLLVFGMIVIFGLGTLWGGGKEAFASSNTYLNGLSLVDSTAPLARKAGHLLAFNGSNMLTVSDSTYLETKLDNTNLLTIEAWIQVVNYNSSFFQGIVLKGGATDWNYHFQLTGNRIGWSTRSSIQDDLISNAELIAGQWYHIAVVFDRDNKRKQIYINGKLDIERVFLDDIGSIIPNNSDNPARQMTIGGWNNGYLDRFFNGKIDDVMIWNVARNRSEILNDMLGDNTGNETGLAGYWKMDEGQGNIVKSLVGTNNSAFFTNDQNGSNNLEWIASTTALINKGDAIAGQVVAGSPDLHSVTYEIVSGPSNGSVNLSSSTGNYQYVHNGSTAAFDSFSFKANNGSLDSNIQTVNIFNKDGIIGIDGIVQTLNSTADLNKDDLSILLSLIKPITN